MTRTWRVGARWTYRAQEAYAVINEARRTLNARAKHAVRVARQFYPVKPKTDFGN